MGAILPAAAVIREVSPGEGKMFRLINIPAAATNDTLVLTTLGIAVGTLGYVQSTDITTAAAAPDVACTWVVATNTVTLTGIGLANVSTLLVLGDA